MERKQKRKIKQFYIKALFLFIFVFIAAFGIKQTIARYTSDATSSANVDLAYYIFSEQSLSQDLKIDSILPTASPYSYTFSVANYQGNERTQTALEYDIEIETTTNLPLGYDVHLQNQNQSLVTGDTTTRDTDQTYFRHITVQGDEFGFSSNQQNIYVLEISFPPFPTNFESSIYEGIIEYIKLTVNSRQKINS